MVPRCRAAKKKSPVRCLCIPSAPILTTLRLTPRPLPASSVLKFGFTRERFSSMLMPKRQKHRKVRKGRVRGVATAGNYIAFGQYALQAQGQERITSRQIEAARQAMTRYIKRGGKIWIRIFPHTPVTRKPQ